MVFDVKGRQHCLSMLTALALKGLALRAIDCHYSSNPVLTGSLAHRGLRAFRVLQNYPDYHRASLVCALPAARFQ